MLVELQPRVALGDSGALGSLYDAHTDRILGRSLFKTTVIPTEAIRPQDNPSITYELTTNDSLEEKFSKLEVSAELKASILGGIVTTKGSGSYLSDAKTSAQIQQASVICNLTTKTEHLHLSHDVLKEIVDAQALKVDGVTHVISGIDWGARCVVTAKSTKSDVIDATEFRGELNNSAGGQGGHGHSVGELLKNIGEAHVGGKLETDNHFKTASSSVEFKINADIVVENAFAIDYEGVCKFIEGIPVALQQYNGGKGIPLKYYFTPIKQVAQIFDVKIKADNLPKRVDEDCLQRFVELFDAFSITKQRLNDYSSRLDDHGFCVPESHRKAARREISKVKRAEAKLKENFSVMLEDVRKGEEDMSALWGILKEYRVGTDVSDEEDSLSAGSPAEYLSILSEFREKMDFADKLKSMGAKYVPNTPEHIDNIFTEGLIDDVYILYFNESTRSHPQWANTINTLTDLLHDMDREDADYNVVVIDCDMPTIKQKKLDKPLIQKLRGKEVIVNDVVADLQERDAGFSMPDQAELAGRSLMRCIGDRKIEKTLVLPAERRPIRMACPGKHCSSPTRHDWICPSCKEAVCFGYSDDYMYCSCGRYHYSGAEYKCIGEMHGSRYTKHENEAHLLGCLKGLDPFEEYNILILGQTGVGKSTFINSFLNYVLFGSLNEAMRNPAPLAFEIPFMFTYYKHGVKYEVRSGMDSKDELISKKGESATQYPREYVFYIDGRIFRFIDTPGIGDTAGLAQDKKNTDNILTILDGVQRISMILFLLKPDEDRLTPALNFCMTELLSHLHKDVVKNIVFGFPRSQSTNYTHGATRDLLQAVLDDQQTGIKLGNDNTNFFDARGFRFLAAYKILGQEMPYRDLAEESWDRSSSAARRLLRHAMSLPSHDVGKTLSMNRIRSTIANMTEPMLTLSTAVKMNMGDLEKQEKWIANLDANTKELSEKLWVTRTEVIRHDLDKPQTVCLTCAYFERDGDEKVLAYPKACHDNCREVPVDGIVGDMSLKKCSVFSRLWFFSRENCWSCSHTWKLHKHISYVFKLERVKTKDTDILKILENNNGTKTAIEEQVKKLNVECDQLKKEEDQIQDALAKFWFYLKENAMAGHNDAIGMYLDQMIAQAKKGGTSENLNLYEEQKEAYEKQKKAMESAVQRGSATVPNEEDLEKIMQKLFLMPLNGKKLQGIISSNSRVTSLPRPPVRAGAKCGGLMRFRP